MKKTLLTLIAMLLSIQTTLAFDVFNAINSGLEIVNTITGTNQPQQQNGQYDDWDKEIQNKVNAQRLKEEQQGLENDRLRASYAKKSPSYCNKKTLPSHLQNEYDYYLYWFRNDNNELIVDQWTKKYTCTGQAAVNVQRCLRANNNNICSYSDYLYECTMTKKTSCGKDYFKN